MHLYLAYIQTAGPYVHVVTRFNSRNMFRFTCINEKLISIIPSDEVLTRA